MKKPWFTDCARAADAASTAANVIAASREGFRRGTPGRRAATPGARSERSSSLPGLGCGDDPGTERMWGVEQWEREATLSQWYRRTVCAHKELRTRNRREPTSTVQNGRGRAPAIDAA